MVTWRKGDTWNGFGFFGESRHGKTPLSFALARVLFVTGIREMKVFDDCFEIEDSTIHQCRVWGSRDKLGETYYAELAEVMRTSGRSIREVQPRHDRYLIANVACYLLQLADSTTYFKKQRCSREEFVEKLMPTDPFTWSYPKPGKEVVFQRFKNTWTYFIIQRQRETNRQLIDALINEAFHDSSPWRDRVILS